MGVDEEGRVSSDEVAAALRPETALVTIMHSNNEARNGSQPRMIFRVSSALSTAWDNLLVVLRLFSSRMVPTARGNLAPVHVAPAFAVAFHVEG